MNKPIKEYIESVLKEVNGIGDTRKERLKMLARFVASNVSKGTPANLIFICTHNSRRSHLAQMWAQVAAYYFGLQNVFCYSGGTAVTALYPMTAKALTTAGFEMSMLSQNDNPVLAFKFAENANPIIGFSKTYDDAFNPQSDFAAVMTCSHADENCPFIPTAAVRISLPFEDPKAFDGTDLQEEKYQERCRDIAVEILYAFSLVESKRRNL